MTGRDGPRFAAIRGISDFADERKKLIEDKYRGAFRQVAIANAATFLWASIQSDLFSEQWRSSAVATTGGLRLRSQFAGFLNSTEIIFQHRNKPVIDLSDLFVYPDLLSVRGTATQRVNSKQLSDLKALSQFTLVIGDAQSGKTSLSKTLFRAYLRQGAFPLFITGNQLKNTRYDFIVNSSFDHEYEGMSLQAAVAAHKPSVLIVDDYQNTGLNKEHQQSFFKHIAKRFDHVITVGSNDVRRIDTKFATFSEFQSFELLPFGHTLRHELVSRWVRLGQEETMSEPDFVQRLDVCDQHVESVLRKDIVPPPDHFTYVR